MKKTRKMLLIVGAVLLTLVILGTGYLFVAVNGHYLFDLRRGAEPYNGLRMDRKVLDNTIRYKIGYADGRVDVVEYANDRSGCAVMGIDPIDFDRRNMWGIWSYEDFVATYGDYHVDVGSGSFIPSWFTVDGYLLSLWMGGERFFPLSISNLGEVWMYDLLALPE